jgi:hypothetical protein
MQIDNDPCPDLIHITIESARGCSSKVECLMKIDKFYKFENNGIRFEKDHKKNRELKEREEREKQEREERDRKLAAREERDRLYWEEKRKKKMKKEKIEEREVNL